MAFDIEAALDALIGREGGYVNHPSDKGGETNWGITEAVARASGYGGAMRDLQRDFAKEIYRRKYWIKPGFSAVATLSPAVAGEMFDTGVNMGPSVPSAWLQRWLNGMNRRGRDYADIAVDGAIGRATLTALAAYLKQRGDEGESVMVKALNCSQGARYLDLAEAREKSEAFLFGWIAGRVS